MILDIAKTVFMKLKVVNLKKIILLNSTTAFPSRGRKFLLLPFTMPTIYFESSGRHLWVSGRCLEVVWVTLNTAWRVIIPNQFVETPMKEH